MSTCRALLLAAFALAGAAAPAQADCGGGGAQHPHHPHRSDRPPLVVGDATMLFAAPYRAHHGREPNARGCRMWSEGLRLLRARKHRHSLPHLVVMGLGANWS